jgi:hypothetical protein
MDFGRARGYTEKAAAVARVRRAARIPQEGGRK